MHSHELTYKKISLFLLPLAVTWFFMSVEGPFLAALIARMPEAKFNLAAYGVAYSFALIVESPIIMIMSAANALIQNRQSFYALRNFIYMLNAIITVVMLIFIIPGVFYFVAEDIVGLTPEIAGLSHIGLILLIPWPAAIGYRRFYQGILIRNKLTRFVAFGTFIRLSTMAVTGSILYFLTSYPGVVIGAGSLSVGVVCEAIASRIMAVKTVSALKEHVSDYKITFHEIFHFYYPLASTSVLGLAIHPMITFFVSKSANAVESLAVLPVLITFTFIFKGPGFAYQDAAIALLKNNYRRVISFGYTLGLIVSLLLAVIAFTPLSLFWFETVSGLSRELSSFAVIPLMIMVVLPAFEVFANLQRAVLVDSRKTKPVTFATALEVITIILILFVFSRFTLMNGVLIASIAFVVGRFLSMSYLYPSYSSAIKSNMIAHRSL